MTDRPDEKAPEQPLAPDAERASEDLVERTEHLADRAIERLVSEVALPDMRAEVGKAQAFFGSIQSPFLWWLVVFYLATAVTGVGVVLVGIEPVGTLPDWYMHAAMYVVIFSFLILYVKAHLQQRRFGRALFALFTLGQISFFAWVLGDLIAPRSIVAVTDARPVVIERPVMELLQLPMILLLVCAGWLAIHWIVLVHFRAPPAGGAPVPLAAGESLGDDADASATGAGSGG